MEQARERVFYMNEIRRMNNEMQEESVLADLNKFQAEEYIKILDRNFTMVRLEHRKLLSDTNVSEVQLNTDYAQIEKIFISLKAKLRCHTENVVLEANPTQSEKQPCEQQPSEQPKLQINWQKFSGQHNDWLIFYVNFGEAVAMNSKLDEARKFELLVDSTEAKAQAMVKEAKSFSEAWNKLEIFYGNAFRRAHATFTELWEIEAMKERSAKEITTLIEHVDGYVDTLRRTLRSDDFTKQIPLIVIGKLDETTKHVWYNKYVDLAKKWARTQATSTGTVPATSASEARNYIPQWLDMRCFLLEESYILKRPVESGSQSGSQSGVQMFGDNSMLKKKPEFCTACGAFHRLYHCGRYRKMSFYNRWDHVETHKLCVRCLHPDHSGSCQDPNNNKHCEHCERRNFQPQYHNSTLCPYVAPGY